MSGTGQSPFKTNYTNNTTILVNTTSETTTNETDLITFIKGTAGNGKVLYVATGFSYNPYLSQLEVPNITSSGTHYANVLEATAGIGILNSSFLELNSSTFKRWLINCTADPTNNLQFAYYNGVFAVTLATLSQTGTFSTTNLSATTLVSAPTMTATGTIQGATLAATTLITSPTMTATGTIKGATLQATSQIHAFDTTALLTANYSYITRASALTYFGGVVSGTPTNHFVSSAGLLDVLGAIYSRAGVIYNYDQVATANFNYFQFITNLTYNVLSIAGVVSVVYYGNNVNFAITGNLYAASYSISCKKRKQNIEDLCGDYCADFITKLKPKKYQYKKLYDKDGNETTRPNIDAKTCFGFLAQDVKADCCGCDDLGVHIEGDGDKFPEALSYNDLIAPLVKVVQDLMITVKEQNERIKVLENKING